MGLYEVPLSISLLGFGMGTMLTNFHMGNSMVTELQSGSICDFHGYMLQLLYM